MKAWSEFFPLVLPFARGLPTITARMAVHRAAIVFLQATRAWREEKPYALEPLQAEVPFAVDEDRVVLGIEEARLAGRFDPLDIGPSRDTEFGRQGRPERIWSIGLASFALWPTPNTPGTLHLKLSFVPSAAAVGIPDDVFEQHRQAIADEALGELLAMPGEPWTDLATAGDKRALRHERRNVAAAAAGPRGFVLRSKPARV